MKIISLNRIRKAYSGIFIAKCYILNPHALFEISETVVFDPIANKYIPATEVLFNDGYKIEVQEDTETVKQRLQEALKND